MQGAVIRNGTLQGLVVRVGDIAEPASSVTVRRVTMLGSGVFAVGGTATVERSRFPDGGSVGWESALTMTGNVIKDSGIGYTVRDDVGQADDSPDIVTDNRFVGNDVAMHLGPGASANVQGNRFTGNRRGIEGHVLDEEWATFRVLLQDNVLTGNVDAIYVPDAFLADPTRYSLQGNRAIRNTGWGIYAPRATDLGGNVARGNGQQPPCVGVAC